ncbi:hypothetical protein [Algoriphagus sediminis]|uniref:Glycosyltransferase RgtA/B/C/D-like domain-containing protein n=1 Tax=Algoriphagus sediminis TaxID=3057113 RepID=A0ABT7YDZ8_9BACT|nr:hypothetical protein [Algoriphagus sediminis]MDN3204756.1 hypothetical protein [Algoriphagus sediminis]
MKLYHENIEFWDFLTIPFYLILAYFLLVFVAKRILLEDDKFINLHFLGLLIFYLLVGLIDYKFKLIPFFPDTNLFTKILETGQTPQEQSIGVRIGYKYLAVPIYKLSLNSIYNYFIFNICFFHVGLTLLAGAFNRFYQVKDVWIQRFFLILGVFSPTVIVYSFTPLRESYFVLALGFFFYGLTKKNAINIFLILGVILAGILRVQLLLYFFILVFAKYLFSLKLRRGVLIALIIALIPIAYFSLNFLAQKIVNIEITPEALSLFRNLQRLEYIKSGVTYPEVFWTNWFQVALDFPGLFFQFLLSPFPVVVFIPFWTKLAYFADGIYLLFILFVAFLSFRKWSKYGMWLLFAGIYVAMSAFFEFHLFGAVRHRLPATLLLMSIAAISMASLYQRYKWIFKY